MDDTEDLSARVLLRQILTTEPPRTPVARAETLGSVEQSAGERRRSSRLINKSAGSQTPENILRRSLRHKIRESITRKSLPAPKMRRSSVVKRTPAHASMLFDDGDTPRHMLMNILRTDPVRSPVVHEKAATEELQPPSANSSIRSRRQSTELSGLDLPDLTLGNTASAAKGLSRKRPHWSLNVTAFEKRLRDGDGVEEQNEESLRDNSLSLSNSTSLNLKTPFVDVHTEKRGLQRRVANRRRITEKEFGAAVNKRHMTGSTSFMQPEQGPSDTAYSEGFTLGLSKLSESDITMDIFNCNTALYAQPDAITSNFSITATQDKPTVMASQLQRQMLEMEREELDELRQQKLLYTFPIEDEEELEERFPESEENMGENIIEAPPEDAAILELEEGGIIDASQTGDIAESEEENKEAVHTGMTCSQSVDKDYELGSGLEEDVAPGSQSVEEETQQDYQTKEEEEEQSVSQTEEEIDAVYSHMKEEEEQSVVDSQLEEEEEQNAVESHTGGDDAVVSQSEEEEAPSDSQRHEEEEEIVDSQAEEEEAPSDSQRHEEEEEIVDSQAEEEEAPSDSQRHEGEEEEIADSPAEEESPDDAPHDSKLLFLSSEEEQSSEDPATVGLSDSKPEDEHREEQLEEGDVEHPSEHISRRTHRSEGGLIMPVAEEERGLADLTGTRFSDSKSKAHATFDLPNSLAVGSEAESDADKENSLHHPEDHPEDVRHQSEESPEEAAAQGGEGEEEEGDDGDGDGDDDDDDEEDTEEFPSKTPAFVKQKRNLFFPDPLSSPSVLKNTQPRSGGDENVVVTAKPKQVKKRRSGKTTKVEGLPKSYLMGIFQHFAKTKVSADVYPVLQEIMDKFFDRMAEDLETYALHAGRKTIEFEDVELLLRRQGHVNDKVPVEVLIEKYLRMDQRRLLIPIATSGNVVFPKKRR